MMLLTRALLVAAVLGSAACSVYDKSLAYSNGGGTDGGGSGSGDACTAQPELCNGMDDDCDGTTDEAEAVTNDCALKVLHSSSTCTTGLCVKIGECETGYFNCDGLPNNGCEATCCGDGCDDDAGAP
jgi:hypothetical protein